MFESLLLLLSMMILIIGFTCPPTIHFKFFTKCDSLFYYKVRQVLLQSAVVCYYNVRQLYYKLRQNMVVHVVVVVIVVVMAVVVVAVVVVVCGSGSVRVSDNGCGSGGGGNGCGSGWW